MANKLKETPENNNPIDKYYDEKLNDLSSPNNLASDKKSKDNSKSVDLDKAEKRSTMNKKGSADSSANSSTGLYSPSSKKSGGAGVNQLKTVFTGKKKAGWIGGGIIGTIIAVLFMIAPVLGPVHMAEALDGFHYAPNYHSRTTRNVRIVKRILARQPINGTDGMSKKLASVDADQLDAHLKKQGFTAQYDGSGKVTAIVDSSNGKTVDIKTKKAVTILDDALPSVKSSQRGYFKTYTKLKAKFHWTSLFKGLSSDESIWSRIRQNRSGDIDANKKPIVDEDGAKVTDADGHEIKRSADIADNAKTGVASIDEGVTVTTEKLNAGEVPSKALKSGVRAATLKAPSPKSLIFGALITSCTVKAVYDSELQAKFTGYSQAMADGLEMMMISDEIKNGNPESLAHIGEFMEQYNNEDGSFANSAAYQLATGQEVTGVEMNSENDVSGKYGVDSFLGDALGVMAGLGGFVNKVPGLSQTCGVINSVVGTTIGSFIATLADWGLGAFEVIAACNPLMAGASGGTTCAAKIGVQAFFIQVLPRLISLVVNSTVQKVIENPEQAFNFTSHASALVGSELYRTGKPVSETEYKVTVDNYRREQAQSNNNLLDRYFAMDNPQSLTRFVATWKTNLINSSVADKFATVLSLPGKMLSSFTSSFINTVSAEGEVASGSYVDPHSSIQRYSTNNEYLDMDLDEVPKKALALMDGDSEKAVAARSTAQYCMGYDYPSGTVVPENQLPLFSNPGVSAEDEEASGLVRFFDDLNSGVIKSPNAQDANAKVQEYCIDFSHNERNAKGKGITTDEYALIGRYVDDIMLLDGTLGLLNPSTRSSGSTGLPNATNDVITSGSSRQLAQQILDIADGGGNISFHYGSRENTFVPVANGQPGKVTDSDVGPTTTPVSAELLRIIIEISKANVVPDLKLGSVTSGDHGDNSTHFIGRAVDIALAGLSTTQKNDLFSFLYSNSSYNGGNFCVGSLIMEPAPAGTKTLMDGSPHVFSQAIKDGHRGHIHLSVTTDTIGGCQ